MIKVALRGLAGRKLRAGLTAIAIVLGVAMVSGTYVLTDTIDSAFDSIFQESYRGTDAVVTAKPAFEQSQDNGGFDQPSLPESTLETVRSTFFAASSNSVFIFLSSSSSIERLTSALTSAT